MGDVTDATRITQESLLEGRAREIEAISLDIVNKNFEPNGDPQYAHHIETARILFENLAKRFSENTGSQEDKAFRENLMKTVFFGKTLKEVPYCAVPYIEPETRRPSYIVFSRLGDGLMTNYLNVDRVEVDPNNKQAIGYTIKERVHKSSNENLGRVLEDERNAEETLLELLEQYANVDTPSDVFARNSIDSSSKMENIGINPHTRIQFVRQPFTQ